jgi:hypothetical protein
MKLPSPWEPDTSTIDIFDAIPDEHLSKWDEIFKHFKWLGQ